MAITAAEIPRKEAGSVQAAVPSTLGRPPVTAASTYVPVDTDIKLRAVALLTDATGTEIARLPLETSLRIAAQGDCSPQQLQAELCSRAPRLLDAAFAQAVTTDPIRQVLENATLAFNDAGYLSRRCSYLRDRAEAFGRSADSARRNAEAAREKAADLDSEADLQSALIEANSSLSANSAIGGFQQNMNNLSGRLHIQSITQRIREALRQAEACEQEAVRLDALSESAREQAAAVADRLRLASRL